MAGTWKAGGGRRACHGARHHDEDVWRAAGGELIDAVERVVAGGSGIDPELVSTVLRTPRRYDPLASLTKRERDVLGLVAEGHSTDRIADRLGLTARTVETHTSRILTKLGLEAD